MQEAARRRAVDSAAFTVAETAKVMSFMACMLLLYCAFEPRRSLNFVFPISTRDVYLRSHLGGVRSGAVSRSIARRIEVTAFVGRSGRGKTTLFNLCAERWIS